MTGPVALRRASELHTAVHLNVAWLEVPHPGLGYYNALRPPLESLGHNVTFMQASSTRGFRDGEQLGARIRAMDIAFVSFGFFPMEQGALPHLHEFSRDRSETMTTLCGVVPLVVLINKEYALMQQKIAWLRQHCVEAALSVHHDVATFQNKSGVPFHRIWFGVDVGLFAQRPSLSTSLFAPQSYLPNKSHEYVYDLGFTGVVRRDQTNNWRYQIWRNAWPLLSKRGLRLFSGPRGGVHVGVAHAEINQSSYIEAMRGSKLWLSRATCRFAAAAEPLTTTFNLNSTVPGTGFAQKSSHRVLFRFLWRTGSSARRANASQYLVRRGRCEHALNTNSC